ncbi:MAG: ribonuclease III [Planctomycetota bacterium]
MAKRSQPRKPKSLTLLQKKLGYSFRNKSFLELGLTHPSYTVEEFTDNERLEFLGDSVLSLAVSEHLYRTLPRSAEGELTRIKSSVVSTTTLARISRKLGLSAFMRIGKGLGSRSDLPDSVHANVTEAVFAAVFLDGGLLPAMDVIIRLLTPEIEIVTASAGAENAKSQLQELAQREHGTSPRYRLVSESGPQHGKTFVVAVDLAGRSFPEFAAHTKKEAEQGAARLAIEALRDKKKRRRRGRSRSSAAPQRKAATPAKKAKRPAKKTGRGRRTARKAATRAASKKKSGKASAAPRRRGKSKRKAAPKKRRKIAKNPYDMLGNT